MNASTATTYRGLIADFGGVLSTSLEGALRSFCIREGLEPDAFERVFSLDAGAKGVLIKLERGAISQAEFIDHLAPAERVRAALEESGACRAEGSWRVGV
jgi:putative hydrolase of the HAD superfamily